jgi:putative phage-type endonuclease
MKISIMIHKIISFVMKRYFQENQEEDTRRKRSKKDDFPFVLPFKAIDVSVPDPPRRIIVPNNERVSSDDILKSLEITQEESIRIAKIPQGSQAWLDFRMNRLTASNFGAAVGMNRYKSPKGLLKDMLWSSFKGNAATKWGSDHEDIARDAYVAHIQSEIDAGTSPYTSIRVEETGLHVNPDRPWLGSSPDGVVHVTTKDGEAHKFLLEIKCPFRKKFYEPAVPDYYNCQIQGVMANMNLPHCDFVVWIPGDLQITRVPFDAEFWDQKLYPGLYDFYHKMYLPAIVAKQNGLLNDGETSEVLYL